MKKKALSLLLVPLILSGCFLNNNNNESYDDTNAIIKKNVTIEFLSMLDDEYKGYLEEIVKEFKKEEPHVKVIITNPLGSGNYSMLEKTIISGFFKGDYPDIVQCYPDNVLKYIYQNKVVKLDDYYSGLSQEEKEDYIPSFIDEGMSYDRPGIYSLPFCKSTELMYYNADVLLNLQLDGVNDNKPIDEAYLNSLTWNELFENLCPKLQAYNATLDADNRIIKEDEKTGESAIFTYDSDENFFITLANHFNFPYADIDPETGKGVVRFDEGGGMKVLMKALKDAKDKKYLHTRKTYKDYVSNLFTNQQALFTVSSTAGLIYNYNRSKPFKVGVAKLPCFDLERYTSINQGPSICILDHKNNDRALASFLLWKFITNKENATSWALKTGYMGIRNSCYTSEEYMNALKTDENSSLYDIAKADNYIKTEEVKDKMFTTIAFRGSSNVRENVGLLLRDCLLSDDLDAHIDELFKYYADEARTHL